MPPRISLVEAAQRAVAAVLHEGGSAIDATAGNGYDTLFLAAKVGASGRVYAFDIQLAALAATAERLERAKLAAQVELVHGGHEMMRDHLPPNCIGKINAVMFNLGYLPGGDKSIVTAADTTLPALEAALRLLAPGGILTVLAYPGHHGGAAETAAVEEWYARLPRAAFALQHLIFPDKPAAPQLWVLSRQ